MNPLKFRSIVLSVILTIMLVACTSNTEGGNRENIKIDSAGSPVENESEVSIDTASIIQKLQGEWKETVYPFRRAHFQESKVKFTEEGIAEQPSFREYKISDKCTFEVNNTKNAKPSDIFLVLVETKACEILNISKDTLILSGFSANTNTDYKIIYQRVQ